MTKELLLQHVEVDALQKEEEEEQQTPMKDIDREIECPRCHDIMILSSDFDRLGYLCHDCNLSLFIN
jgi:cytochrome c-type biogenesis protein CcmH/NrfF